jgi:hypothetical protein
MINKVRNNLNKYHLTNKKIRNKQRKLNNLKSKLFLLMIAKKVVKMAHLIIHYLRILKTIHNSKLIMEGNF